MAKENATTSGKQFVGLDTIYWQLEKGNLLIEQKIRDFMEQLKKEFCVGTNSH